MSGRYGVTLVEMVVVLTLMGVLAGIGGLALASLRQPPGDPWVAAVAKARERAIESGSAVVLAADSAHRSVLLLPDGRAVGAGVDPLTGEVLRAGR